MISSGHRFEDIKKYKIKQFDIFLNAYSELEIERMRHDAIAGRASQVDEKEFKKFVKE